MAALVATAVPSGLARSAGAEDGTVVVEPALEARAAASPADAPLAVEIVTAATTAMTREVRSSGGTVTGVVAGEVVQATVAAGSVEDIGAHDTAYVRTPRRVNRPVPVRTELGSLIGEAVGITNAAAWHAAGLRGAVKIGVIDFFDLGLWSPAEHGPLPDAGHRFCLDTSGLAPNYCPMQLDGENDGDGEEHGVAVVEIVKDVAPDAELYVATAATTADMRAAIDWLAANDVRLVTRSLGAPFDGPGDGTGPLAAVVDHAAALGMTWFNSVGNDSIGSYGRYTNPVTADGYVDFDNGPGIDTTLTLVGECIGFDGIRWDDWYEPGRATDYRVEISDPEGGSRPVPQAPQTAGAPPLELVDHYLCSMAGHVSLRIRRLAAGADEPDVIELGLFSGHIEPGRSHAEFSASKPVVDSRNPALVAVGAVDPPASASPAFYTSQGPTNDGRTKPDIAAPSCISSTIYTPALYGPGACFNGTSASAPVAAGIAALLLGRRLATTGANLAALVRHLTVDIGPPGVDNLSGAGVLRLPDAPPPEVDSRPASFTVLDTPRRLLDTRRISPTPGARIGPFPPLTILDLPVGAIGPNVTAVAVSLVSVDSVLPGYAQALPTLVGELGGFANLNVAFAGQVRPNFAVVPIGAGGSISVFLPTGGNLVVDLMGVFLAEPTGAARAGRYVPVDPVRVLDTRSAPVPPSWTAHKPSARETVVVGGLPAGARSVVLNITATDADAAGFLRAQATGTGPAETANGNYLPGTSSGTLSIVPVGVDGTVSVFTSSPAHVVADLLGWFTGDAAPPDSAGLFVPVTPRRTYDSRVGPAPLDGLATRTVPLAGDQPTTPPAALAVSLNLASDGAAAEGFVTMWRPGGAQPLISNLNFPVGAPISNAALTRPGTGGVVEIYANRRTHVIIDVNGYFTGAA